MITLYDFCAPTDGVAVGVGEAGTGVAELVGLAVGVRVGVGVAVPVAVGVAVTVGVGVRVAVGVDVAVGVAVGVEVGIAVFVGVADIVGVANGVGVAGTGVGVARPDPAPESPVNEKMKFSRFVYPLLAIAVGLAGTLKTRLAVGIEDHASFGLFRSLMEPSIRIRPGVGQ